MGAGDCQSQVPVAVDNIAEEYIAMLAFLSIVFKMSKRSRLSNIAA
jgi:hypothetical protein